MSGYLRKYVGTYRVKADYDLDTEDYPRNHLGEIDPSFDDLYIECKDDIKIRHGVGNVLSCVIPSKVKGANILKKIYKDKVSKKIPSENKDTKKYRENLCNQLMEKEILIDAEVLDYEVYFSFKANLIDYIAPLVGAKTSGSNISPFSVKNLPKTPYTIPKDDMDKYKLAIENIPKRTVTIKNQTREMIDGLIIKNINNEFNNIHNIDSKDIKSKGLKNKEYYHSIGIWDEYCEFIKNYKGDNK